MLFTSCSPEDTEELGFYLGNIIKVGSIICLTGDLGVGKTEFVKGFAKGVGVDDYVTSPTFTIINEYNGRMPVYHFDVYRINSVEEMYETGYEEYFFGEGVSIIEWADLIQEIIPEENITVHISKDLSEGLNFRSISIKTSGEIYDSLIRDMLEKCDF